MAAPLIAVVEDDIGLAEIYSVSLQTAGFRVVVGHDGNQGLVLIQQHKPDLVLLDIMMPNMSGDQVLKVMRESDWGKDIPVIMLTNISEAEAPDLLQTLSFQGYLIKANNSPSQIIERVNQELAKTNAAVPPSTDVPPPPLPTA